MRWYGHLADARGNSKNYLHNSMRKYGCDNFLWEIIDQAKSLEELNLKEATWLAHYKQIQDVYNLREAGNNKKHHSESREKMRESQRLAHARRRALGIDTWTRRDGGAMLGKTHPKKGKPSTKWTEEMKKAHSIRCLIREAEKKRKLQGD